MSEYIITCDDEVAMWVGNDVETMKRIVKCKDCRWCVEADAFYDCEHFARHICWNEGKKPDGFCAWGERDA